MDDLSIIKKLPPFIQLGIFYIKLNSIKTNLLKIGEELLNKYHEKFLNFYKSLIESSIKDVSVVIKLLKRVPESIQLYQDYKQYVFGNYIINN